MFKAQTARKSLHQTSWTLKDELELCRKLSEQLATSKKDNAKAVK